MHNFFTFLFFSFYSITSIFAQNLNTDTSYNSAVLNIISLYKKTLGENTHLLNGPEYIEDHPGISGTSFWKADLPQEGGISYDGIFYPNTLLAYDIAKQEIVIRNQQQLSVKLLPEKIDYFILFNQLFTHIISDSTAKSGFKSGFYNILYNGTVRVLAYRRKKALRVLVPTDHSEFIEQDIYFIKNEDRYFGVDDKNSLLDALKYKREEIKKFIKRSRFDFKRDFENSVIKTADYYSQLKK